MYHMGGGGHLTDLSWYLAMVFFAQVVTFVLKNDNYFNGNLSFEKSFLVKLKKSHTSLSTVVTGILL